VTVTYGRVSDETGAPLQGAWIQLRQGSNWALARTDVNGEYLFFDGQACLPTDGLQSCGGASSTTWTFGSGNVASSLTVLGNGASPSPSPLAMAGTYPTTSPQVTQFKVTGMSAFSTATPVYTLTVAKGSAYNRNWTFKP
jgi:hypothetical protein